MVGIAKSYEEALRQTATHLPDMVLMDIHIKGAKSGIEAARAIYDLHQIPVVFLTAYGDKRTFDEALQAEPFGYILKPFQDKDLQRTLEIASQKHSKSLQTNQELDTYKNILSQIDIPLIVFDLNYQVQFFNQQAEFISGYLQQEVLHQKITALLDFNPAEVIANLPSFFQKHRTFQFSQFTKSVHLLHPNQSKTHIYGNIFPILDTEEQIQAYFTLIHQQPDKIPQTTQSLPDWMGISNQTPQDTLFIKDKSRLIAVKFSEILWIEAMDNYTCIITPGRKVVANLYLKNILEHIPQDQFLRVHRTYIIPLDKIERMEDHYVYIQNQAIPVSKTYYPTLLKKLKII